MTPTVIDEGAEAEILPDGEGWVIKLYRSSAGTTTPNRELEALQHLHSHGFPVPKPHELLQRHGRTGLRMSKIDGQPFEGQLFEDPDCGRRVGAVLAGLHIRLHSLPELSPTEIPTAASLFTTAAQEAGVSLPADATDKRLAHGDFHPANVLDTPAGPVVIDLGRAFLGPAAADIATCVLRLRSVRVPAEATPTESLNFGRNIEEIERAYLSSYAASSALNRGAVEVWLRVVAAEARATRGGADAVLKPLIGGSHGPRWS